MSSVTLNTVQWCVLKCDPFEFELIKSQKLFKEPNVISYDSKSLGLHNGDLHWKHN